jgi:hypothetical protein
MQNTPFGVPAFCSAARTRTWNLRLTRNPVLSHWHGLYLHPPPTGGLGASVSSLYGAPAEAGFPRCWHDLAAEAFTVIPKSSSPDSSDELPFIADRAPLYH